MRRMAFVLASTLVTFLAVPSCSLNPQPLPPLTGGNDSGTNGPSDALSVADASRDSAGGGPFDSAPVAEDGEDTDSGGGSEAGVDGATDAPADGPEGGGPDAADARD
jgi:hypothetical protein